jgi:hypothetical protein
VVLVSYPFRRLEMIGNSPGKSLPEYFQEGETCTSTTQITNCRFLFALSGYTPQRLILTHIYGSLPENQSQIWSRKSLRECKYDVGTEFTDHVVVLDKTPKSIVFRAASSPRHRPDSPRDMDGLVEILAVPDFENGHVDFIFKTAFFAGTGFKGAPGTKLIPAVVEYAHRQYTKLLMESAIARVREKQQSVARILRTEVGLCDGK